LAAIAFFLTTLTLNRSHPIFNLIQNTNELPDGNNLILPSSNSNTGAWSLTLQLLTSQENIIDKPQSVTKELEQVLSQVRQARPLLNTDCLFNFKVISAGCFISWPQITRHHDSPTLHVQTHFQKPEKFPLIIGG
jgi:hypothetical protein